MPSPVIFHNLPVLQPPPIHTMRVGQRLLIVGINENVPSNLFGQVQIVTSPMSAFNLFGQCRLLQAIGETFSQGINQVLAVCISQASDLQQLFDSLSGIGIDICLILNTVANPSNFELVGSIAYSREMQGMPIVFVMDSDLSQGTSANQLVNYLPAQNAGSYSDQTTSAPIQFSRYIVQIPDQIIFNPNTPIQYQTGAAAVIAGLMASKTSSTTLTNQNVKNIKIVSPYSSIDAAQLAKNGYLTLRNSVKRGQVINYAVTSTSSKPASQIYSQGFHSLVSLRTCQFVVAAIQQETQPFIGNNISTLMLNDAVAKALNVLKKQNVIVNAQFNITVNQVQSYASIVLFLNLATEITTVTVNAQLNYIRT